MFDQARDFSFSFLSEIMCKNYVTTSWRMRNGKGWLTKAVALKREETSDLRIISLIIKR